ncbi:hypothetical protein BZA05DRAFT_134508 [Tricharina praecox]|uniref:uncharacterized protein n=1 Tax=Tricharina praecox TaxID=43433 RepID=UPI002220F423|nr:uncharacterized protein BZA05DRAFT_134508 [Tricharina praecox]KAI5846708.1 hypothetical protein BZA05DRAFT_134508 [Tricharina praecox]
MFAEATTRRCCFGWTMGVWERVSRCPQDLVVLAREIQAVSCSNDEGAMVHSRPLKRSSNKIAHLCLISHGAAPVCPMCVVLQRTKLRPEIFGWFWFCQLARTCARIVGMAPLPVKKNSNERDQEASSLASFWLFCTYICPTAALTVRPLKIPTGCSIMTPRNYPEHIPATFPIIMLCRVVSGTVLADACRFVF